MTPAEKAKKIQEIYDKAVAKIKILGEERKALVNKRNDIFKNFIKDLENKKIQDIRSSMDLDNK